MRNQFALPWTDPIERLDSLSDQQIQTRSTSLKLTKIEQTLLTNTASSWDKINCSCYNYDGQFYPSSSSSQQQTLSGHMTVNVPVIANFQVNLNIIQSAYSLVN